MKTLLVLVLGILLGSLTTATTFWYRDTYCSFSNYPDLTPTAADLFEEGTVLEVGNKEFKVHTDTGRYLWVERSSTKKSEELEPGKKVVLQFHSKIIAIGSGPY